MKQPTLEARAEYLGHESNSATTVTIPGTGRHVTLREIHPGTVKRVTRLWIERDLAAASVKDGSEALKDLCVDPYLAFKEAAMLYLNNDLKLRFVYPFLWRWWAFRYTESQMLPIIAEGKKKLPVMAHYATIMLSRDMRTDMISMTEAEAGPSQAGRS